MAARLSALIDLNVILDVFQQREQFYVTSARVLACAEARLFEGWIAAHSVTTLFYLIAKYRSAERARVAVSDLMNILSVAAVDGTAIQQALTLPYSGFEDAVQMAAAIQAGVQYLVTRDIRGYRSGPLPVLQPVEFLALL
jgi:predicted nucleic acid-binding protein